MFHKQLFKFLFVLRTLFLKPKSRPIHSFLGKVYSLPKKCSNKRLIYFFIFFHIFFSDFYNKDNLKQNLFFQCNPIYFLKINLIFKNKQINFKRKSLNDIINMRQRINIIQLHLQLLDLKNLLAILNAHTHSHKSKKFVYFHK
jgi:hypothetical protein